MIILMLQDVPGVQLKGKLATVGREAARQHIDAGRAVAYVPPRFRSKPGLANPILYPGRVFLLHDCPEIGLAGDTRTLYDPEKSWVIDHGYGLSERLARDQTRAEAATRRGKATVPETVQKDLDLMSGGVQ